MVKVGQPEDLGQARAVGQEYVVQVHALEALKEPARRPADTWPAPASAQGNAYQLTGPGRGPRQPLIN